MDTEKFDRIMHFIAQGVINITEGRTTIEASSAIHRAMEELCEAVHKGEVGLTACPMLTILHEDGNVANDRCRLDEFLAANLDTPDLCAEVAALDVGQAVEWGGGAAPYVKIIRNA